MLMEICEGVDPATMICMPSVCTPGWAVSVEKALVEPVDRVVIPPEDRQLETALRFGDVRNIGLYNGERLNGHAGGLRRDRQVDVDALRFSDGQIEVSKRPRGKPHSGDGTSQSGWDSHQAFALAALIRIAKRPVAVDRKSDLSAGNSCFSARLVTSFNTASFR